MKLWPHQVRVLSETDRLMSDGISRICVTAPTGAGKSLIMVEEAERAIKRGIRVGLLTPRRLLTDQIIGYFEQRQIPFSVRAAGYEDQHFDDRAIQICSALTEHSRVNKRLKLPELGAGLLLVDEVHLQSRGVPREVIDQNHRSGAKLIGYTATPVGLRDMFDALVVGGSPSELRQQGSLLPAKLYDNGCPDLKKVKRQATGEFVAADLQRINFCHTIVGKVVEHYKRLNPHGLPTILFAPGLPESKWFVDRFEEAGIHAAHIDGEDIYVDGQEFRRDCDAKEQLFRDVRSGRVKVLCNRFVCREGVDIPELYYGILACPIGSLQSYLQAIGRLLRAHPSMTEVRVADHGGNINRHGSPNEDRDWGELWGLNSREIESIRELRIKANKQEPGFACRQCGLTWGRIPQSGKCECGHDLTKTFECFECGELHRKWPLSGCCQKCGENLRKCRKRRVIEESGTLKEVADEYYRKRPEREMPNSAAMWERWYIAMRLNRPDKKLSQIWGWYCHEHYEMHKCYPPRNLKLMPKFEIDWYKPVGELKIEELR